MKARWFALLIPAALALGFAHDADAGGYGHKQGHYGYSQSHGYSYGGYRRHGYAPAYSHHNRGQYRPGYRHGYRSDYRSDYRPVYRAYRNGYRHGYRSAHPAYRYGYSKGRHHGHSRSYRSYRPHPYRGGITLHFGF